MIFLLVVVCLVTLVSLAERWSDPQKTADEVPAAARRLGPWGLEPGQCYWVQVYDPKKVVVTYFRGHGEKEMGIVGLEMKSELLLDSDVLQIRRGNLNDFIGDLPEWDKTPQPKKERLPHEPD